MTANADPSDATQNTGSSDATQNTGSGQPDQPADNRDRDREGRDKFNIGYSRGIEKTLKKLGLPDDLAEAHMQLESLREQRQANPAPSEAGDISAHPEYRNLQTEHEKIRREYTKIEQRMQTLQAQADISRQLAIKQAAIEAGVGPGRQADAFVRLYGDLFELGDDGGLMALTKAANGDLVPGVADPSEVIAEALKEAAFLVAPSREQMSGTGRSQEPTRPPPTDDEAWREKMRKMVR